MEDQNTIRPRCQWPTVSCRDGLVLLATFVLTGSGALVGALTGRWIIGPLCFIAGLFVWLLYWTRHLGPEARQAGLLFLFPFTLGVAASYHPAVGSYSGVIGAIVSIALMLWYKILRHPPEFRAAARQYRAGDMARTCELLESSIERRPRHWPSYQMRAVANLWLHRVAEAEQDARAALRLKPNCHSCHAALGQALIARGQVAEAKAAYSRARELASRYAINHYGKALACFRLQEFQEAADLLRIAVRGKLPYVEQRLLAHYYLGHSLLQLGQSADAQAAFQTMAQYREGYEKLLARYQDAPDYPGTVALRRELGEIKARLDGSA